MVGRQITAEEAQANTNRGLAQSVKETRPESKCDETYRRIWTKFKKWVDEQRILNTLPNDNPKYLLEVNIDAYFLHVVQEMDVQPATARKNVSALQYFADKVEHIGQDFKVESTNVKTALENQKHKRLQKRGGADGDTDARDDFDPHANLPTDIMTEEELSRVIDLCITSESNWRDLSLSFTTCEQTLIRADSARKLRFQHLRLNRSHGPKNIDYHRAAYPRTASTMQSRKPMLEYILRADGLEEIHKDNRDDIRCSGGWRHVDCFRCCTGMLAMNFLTRFRTMDRMNFKARTVGGLNQWRNMKFIEVWRDHQPQYSAYSAVLRKAEVKWKKVTHLRSQGIETISRDGADRSLISTLSKHDTE